MNTKSELGKFILKRCIDLDISMSELAKQCGKSNTTFSLIITGDRRIPLSLIEPLEKVLKLNENSQIELRQLIKENRANFDVNYVLSRFDNLSKEEKIKFKSLI